jgi:hypothetical protein
VTGCAGLAMSEPEEMVACYRAGHPCPPKVALVTVTDTHRVTRYKCPCCGAGGTSFGIPLEWDAATEDLARVEASAENLANS